MVVILMRDNQITIFYCYSMLNIVRQTNERYPFLSLNTFVDSSRTFSTWIGFGIICWCRWKQTFFFSIRLSSCFFFSWKTIFSYPVTVSHMRGYISISFVADNIPGIKDISIRCRIFVSQLGYSNFGFSILNLWICFAETFWMIDRRKKC